MNCAFVALSHVPSLAEDSSLPFLKNAMSLVDINVTSVKDINHILMPLRLNFNPQKKEKMRGIAMKQWATFASCIHLASEHGVPITENVSESRLPAPSTTTDAPASKCTMHPSWSTRCFGSKWSKSKKTMEIIPKCAFLMFSKKLVYPKC